MRTRNRPHTLDSLLSLTQPDGQCLLWQGATRNNGYGIIRYLNLQTTVHRVVYRLVYGDIADELEVDHTCNNRGCINPDHLQVVSHAENMRLSRIRRTHCRSGHEWTEENTYTTLVRRRQGGFRVQRYCRRCRADQQAALRLRRINNKGGLVR